jgi:hypothetical protein
MLFTVIRVFRDHVLRDYDSGLTCPRLASINGRFAAGATIRFYYALGNHPRLQGEVVRDPDSN